MRVITTLSLTHSDGYSAYEARNIYHDFYDADLGRPVGEKAQTYDSRYGIFIREFDNGWAVYNRSGRPQTINLPIEATGAHSGLRDTEHVLEDLDGEIYLKSESGLETPLTADVNEDGIVNILDLVVVANAFGEPDPDVNGDGTVNVLDLVAVANAFNN